ncbi:Lrp/AsnC family transcriptional regulator [Tsukamurella asaccharolytica]|uniref:Lrp/AsnC family transcriptional regulator n=1 Tax=Tsukamurella asaccharolytica TaxID=2592067 RepID=A0A5C5RH34_9ACTN|nr:Lrp/AsnC family transcriptional regulator [Tsukamurella asaccharolytica]TWS21511.1 Lrp/AsnC family transcriptional regulator [Tsukamurella asaccharolytica]
MPTTSLRLDEIDVRLIDALQIDADRTLRDLGEEVGLSPSAVQRRVQKYKRDGLIRTVAQIVPERAPALTQALVFLALTTETPETHRRLTDALRAHPLIRECLLLAGEWDYVVVVSAASVQELRDVCTALFKADGNIRRYDTMFILDTVVAGARIPAEYLT